MNRLGARIILVMVALGASAALAGVFDLPKPQPPDRYGTILIDRAATEGPSKAVAFSHWRHRARYSCRVCHYELGFEFEKNASEITEADNKHGLFCGACHDGTEAFPVTDTAQCDRCHTGKIRSEKAAFKKFSSDLPKAPYGNEVDWVQAQEVLKPRFSLSEGDAPLDFEKEV